MYLCCKGGAQSLSHLLVNAFKLDHTVKEPRLAVRQLTNKSGPCRHGRDRRKGFTKTLWGFQTTTARAQVEVKIFDVVGGRLTSPNIPKGDAGVRIKRTYKTKVEFGGMSFGKPLSCERDPC